MKVLHILTSGKAGGIETLCREISSNSKYEHGFCFVTAGGEICDTMKRSGIAAYELFHMGKNWSFKKLNAIKQITKNYDVLVIHNEDIFMELYYLIVKILVKKPGIRYVHSCYADEMQQDKNVFKRWLKNIVRQLSIDKSERIIYVSKAGKDSCESILRVDENKCRIIYNGISEKYLEAGSGNIVSADKPIEVLYVGRLERIKGVDMLIKAFSELQNKYDIHLSIVGDGSVKGHLIQLAEENNLAVSYSEYEESDITFWGLQVDIIPYLKRASVFVYPSVCQEVFGISLAEAMAFGLTCVAHRVGGIPEIIIDGVNGYLTESVSEQDLYKKIEAAISTLDKENMRIQMSEAAFRTAQKFSIKNTCLQLDEVFEELVH